MRRRRIKRDEGVEREKGREEVVKSKEGNEIVNHHHHHHSTSLFLRLGSRYATQCIYNSSTQLHQATNLCTVISIVY